MFAIKYRGLYVSLFPRPGGGVDVESTEHEPSMQDPKGPATLNSNVAYFIFFTDYAGPSPRDSSRRLTRPSPFALGLKYSRVLPFDYPPSSALIPHRSRIG